MGIPDTTRRTATTAVSALGDWVSVHIGAGAGLNGANETSGGGYGRRSLAPWANSGANARVGTEVTVPVAAGTYTEAGLWSAETGGTFVGSGGFTGGGSIQISGTGASIVLILTVAGGTAT